MNGRERSADGAPAPYRRPWIVELMDPAPACPPGLRLLYCFPAGSDACLSARFCFQADLAALAATLGRARQLSREQPEVILLDGLPEFLPGLLAGLAADFGVPVIPARDRFATRRERLRRRVEAILPRDPGEGYEPAALNRRLERLRDDSVLPRGGPA